MPLYEYKCHSCGKTFEVIQKFSDEPLKTHDECGGAVERLLSAPAFHLKGTGWYATDYAKSTGAPKAEGKSDDSKSGSESKKDSGGESKPAETKTASETKSSEAKSSESKPAPTSSSDAK